jgi:hypothetical protein
MNKKKDKTYDIVDGPDTFGALSESLDKGDNSLIDFTLKNFRNKKGKTIKRAYIEVVIVSLERCEPGHDRWQGYASRYLFTAYVYDHEFQRGSITDFSRNIQGAYNFKERKGYFRFK